MDGPLKRTALRTSPEDAEHYKKFHDRVLEALRGGTPREELLKELAGNGVPASTAERIVYSVEQQVEHAAFSSRASRTAFWISWSVAGIFVFLGAAYAAWQMGEHRRIPLRVALPGMAIVIAAMVFTFGRFSRRIKPPDNLPPPM
jgi:hypothetical protein